MIAMRVECDECGRRFDVGQHELDVAPSHYGVWIASTIALPEGWSTRGDGIVSPLRFSCWSHDEWPAVAA